MNLYRNIMSGMTGVCAAGNHDQCTGCPGCSCHPSPEAETITALREQVRLLRVALNASGDAIGLLNSMVLSGESHSESSQKVLDVFRAARDAAMLCPHTTDPLQARSECRACREIDGNES